MEIWVVQGQASRWPSASDAGGALEKSYEVFCLSDTLFYDSPTHTRGDDVDLAIAQRPVPAGWQRSDLDDWLVYMPADVVLPKQGWKLHSSGTLDNAEEVVTIVWDYCVPRNIPFKFVRSRQLLLLRNAKYADRGSSGKLVTIFPRDDEQFEAIATELAPLLHGKAGPYILSDLRWGDGPLYARYGGFFDQWCVGPGGQLEAAISDPDGNHVPDRREPTFWVPPWVSLPACLEPHLAARKNAKLDEIPYKIDEAIHFSNGGGLYLGTDTRTGERVVLKEARPHAGLSAEGADAVTRLQRERDMMQRLAGLDAVPALHDYFVFGDHHFLVLEFVDGKLVSKMMAERHPLTTFAPDPSALESYATWAVDVATKLEQAVASIHDRGVVIGDLHPFNVLVRPDGRVALIDWEVACGIEENGRPTLGAPGFAAPLTQTGFDIDEYALASIRLWLFLPLTMLFPLCSGKETDLAGDITRIFPVPRAFVESAARRITEARRGVAAINGERAPQVEPTDAAWPETRASLVRAILASATPERTDRLFPGDPRQFEPGGGLCMAYGAAGVLYALDAAGERPPTEHVEWLLRSVRQPEPGTRLGFYDGLHGVAYALQRLGQTDAALTVLDICARELNERWDRLGTGLMEGLSGIGLNLLYFATTTGEEAYLQSARAIATAIAGRLGDEGSVDDVSSNGHPYAGLTRGSSGIALFFVRLYETMGDPSLLDLAATALRQDLKRTVVHANGALEVNEGWRTMPYLSDGAVGIGMALREYLRHRDDEGFARAVLAIELTARGNLFVEPGLFWGRSGMIPFVATLPADQREDAVARHLRALNWHAIPYAGGIAFPGDQLFRLSMDLATGTAGVLFAIASAFENRSVQLPFLAPFIVDSSFGEDGEVLASGRR